MKPNVRFFRHDGICRPMKFFSITWAEVPLPGRVRPRLTARTHRRFYALLIVATSTGRLFLGGLLASIARLRFTDTPILIPFRDRDNGFTANGQQCLNRLSQPRGPLHLQSTYLIPLSTRRCTACFFPDAVKLCHLTRGHTSSFQAHGRQRGKFAVLQRDQRVQRRRFGEPS